MKFILDSQSTGGKKARDSSFTQSISLVLTSITFNLIELFGMAYVKNFQ